MDAVKTLINDASLCIHFNAFTGRLEGGYIYSHRTKMPLSGHMRASEVLAYLTANPEVRCNPMKV